MGHKAARENHLNVVKELLDRGADIEAQSMGGGTALHIAAGSNHLDVVKELLDRGANQDAQDDDGETALHRAVRHYKELFAWLECEDANLNVIKELLERGANALTKNVDGRTALELAREQYCGNTELARFLEMAEEEHRENNNKVLIYVNLVRIPLEIMAKIIISIPTTKQSEVVLC